jgi:hypothetical protein
MATEPLVNDGCACIDWQENMPKINGPIIREALRTGFDNYKGGKGFMFCPWCGVRLPSTVSEP